MDQDGKTFAQMLFEPGAGSEKVNEIYDNTSATYDDYMLSHNYTAHIQVANAAARLFQDLDVKLLDAAAGTGLAGLELQKRGFKQLDAVDASRGMLKEAAKKEVYSRLLCAFLNDQPLDIPAGSYDGVVCAGSMGDNHLPCTAFLEMVRLVKPGGCIIVALREEFLGSYKEELDRMFQKLEQDRKWKLESRDIYPRHYDHHNGVLFVFRVL